jgi:CopG family nickel-responsive transcriptional regulator
MHVHLDHARCLEVIVLRGRSKEVRQTANLLISTKGVTHGNLIVAMAEPGHAH